MENLCKQLLLLTNEKNYSKQQCLLHNPFKNMQSGNFVKKPIEYRPFNRVTFGIN
jgi:hypothetical protein